MCRQCIVCDVSCLVLMCSVQCVCVQCMPRVTAVRCCGCRGVWNVPYVSSVYLLKAHVLRSDLDHYGVYSSDTEDADMAFCSSVRSKVGYEAI